MKSIRPSEGVRRAYQRLAASFDGPVTLPQAAILRSLLVGARTQTQIVSASGIDRSTVGEMLRRMHAQGLTTAKQSEEDKRANLVEITKVGRRALIKANHALFMAEAAMMQMVPSADRAAFLRALRAIALAP